MKFTLSIIMLFTALTASAQICLDVKAPESENFEFINDIKIKSFDGIHLSANMLIPNFKKGPLPTVIFVNSWTLAEHEYLAPAIELANRGFQVLNLAMRGWGCSEGEVEVLGPKEVKDVKVVLDYLVQLPTTDRNNIGIAGISYGGGTTLMMLAKDDRIKTGVAMSAWASLSKALFDQGTVRLLWGEVLVQTGHITGNLSPKITTLFNDVKAGKNTEEIINWANQRSPIEFIHEVNKRNVPVFIANNFNDNLFQPNNVLDYYNKLTSPKLLDLNQGTHATSELGGLFGISNYTFERVYDWFEHWLKNKKTSISSQLGTINLQLDLQRKREIISEKNFRTLKTHKLYIHPRTILNGKLLSDSYEDKLAINTIYGGIDTLATTGIPLISDIFDGNFQIPVYQKMAFVNPLNGIQYRSERYKKGLKLRGIPKLELNIQSHAEKFQTMVYLYDIGPFGFAKLITHGTYTSHTSNKSFEMDLVMTAYDLPPGHKIGLVIDTKEILYQDISEGLYRMDFIYDPKKPMKLSLPIK